jgi:serine/threonine protein kinase
VLTSPTYEPPECKLHRPVSRAYDLWSLGCVYLEFITWLLKGSKEIETFADFRGRQSSIGINDDRFFTITTDHINGNAAVVRQELGLWAEQLHQHAKCSELIHDLIDLTMEQLLIVEFNNRVTAGGLFWDMKKLLDRSEADKEYMLNAVAPKPKQRSWARSHSTSASSGKPGKTDTILKSNNSFSGTLKSPAPVIPQLDDLRELPLLGTPALTKTKKKSVTWPPGPPLTPVHEHIEHERYERGNQD